MSKDQKSLILMLSNSQHSINRKFANELKHSLSCELIELKNYQVDFYSVDLEATNFPDKIKTLVRKIKEHSNLIFVTPEHNGFIPAFAKNIIDWMTRDEQYGRNQFLKGLNGVICCVTPATAGGGKTVLELLDKFLSFSGLNVKGTVLVNGYHENFDFKPFIEQVKKLI